MLHEKPKMDQSPGDVCERVELRLSCLPTHQSCRTVAHSIRVALANASTPKCTRALLNTRSHARTRSNATVLPNIMCMHFLLAAVDECGRPGPIVLRVIKVIAIILLIILLLFLFYCWIFYRVPLLRWFTRLEASLLPKKTFT